MHGSIPAIRRLFHAGLLLATMAPAIARADVSAAAPGGIRGEMIANINDAAGKVEELAGAVPESKYGWAPAKGVRTAGQVFLHIVAANYMLPGAVGVPGGMSMDEGMKLDKTPVSKAKTQQMLKESYAFLDKAIAEMSDADMEAQVDFFGNKMSKRAVLLAALAHTHEHLGQSIAYARAMGITPPWTARQNAAAPKKMAGGKPEMPK